MLEVTKKTRVRVPRTAVHTIVRRAFGRASMEVSLVFVGDALMQKLNRTYRKKNTTTDVLSFLLEPGLGEIIISVPQARRDADGEGISMRTKIIRLVAHGTAHISGHDHMNVSERVIMERLEARLVRGLL